MGNFNVKLFILFVFVCFFIGASFTFYFLQKNINLSTTKTNNLSTVIDEERVPNSNLMEVDARVQNTSEIFGTLTSNMLVGPVIFQEAKLVELTPVELYQFKFLFQKNSQEKVLNILTSLPFSDENQELIEVDRFRSYFQKNDKVNLIYRYLEPTTPFSSAEIQKICSQSTLDAQDCPILLSQFGKNRYTKSQIEGLFLSNNDNEITLGPSDIWLWSINKL